MSLNKLFAAALVILGCASTSPAAMLTIDLPDLTGVQVTANQSPFTIVNLNLSGLTSIQSVRLEWSAYVTPGLILGPPGEKVVFLACIGCDFGFTVDDRQMIVRPVSIAATLRHPVSQQTRYLSGSYTHAGGMVLDGNSANTHISLIGDDFPDFDDLLASGALEVSLSLDGQVRGRPYGP